MLPLDHLRSPISRSEMFAWLLDKLQQLGIETTGWQDGRIQKTMLNLAALLGSDLTESVRKIADMGFNDTSTGDALTEFSKSRYDNDRIEAIATRGPMTLRSTATIPYDVEFGKLVATTEDGVLFRNVNETTVTVPAGSAAAPSSAVIDFEAVLKGYAGNVPRLAVNRLVTPLAGVTVSNDAAPTWHTTAGRDEEADEILRRRNKTKWATQTVELVRDSYENIALSNGARKVVVSDLNPRGPGTIDVWCAGESSALGAADMQAIQLAFSQRAFQTSASWPAAADSRVAVMSPEPIGLDITVWLYHDPNIIAPIILDRAKKRLREWLRKTPIGGWDYRPGPYNIIQREDLIDELKDVEGMRTVIMPSPAESYLVNPYQVLIEGNWDLRPVPVTAATGI